MSPTTETASIVVAEFPVSNWLLGFPLAAVFHCSFHFFLPTRRSFVFSMQTIPLLLARQDACIGPNDCPEPEPCNCASDQECIIINRQISSVFPPFRPLSFFSLQGLSYVQPDHLCCRPRIYTVGCWSQQRRIGWWNRRRRHFLRSLFLSLSLVSPQIEPPQDHGP